MPSKPGSFDPLIHHSPSSLHRRANGLPVEVAVVINVRGTGFPAHLVTEHSFSHLGGDLVDSEADTAE